MDESAPYAYFEDVNWGLLRLWGERIGAAILDVGCGFATTSERLRKLGNRVTGIESSPEAVTVAGGRPARSAAASRRSVIGCGVQRRARRPSHAGETPADPGATNA